MVKAKSGSRSPQAVQSLLSRSGGTLGEIHRRARELTRLDKLLAPLLAESLRAHVRVCAVHGSQLVLQVDAPVWSTRLRLEQPGLLVQLRAIPSFAAIDTLRITVAAPAATTGGKPRTATISASAARAIAQCAESQSDPALRDSLARLSRRA